MRIFPSALVVLCGLATPLLIAVDAAVVNEAEAPAGVERAGFDPMAGLRDDGGIPPVSVPAVEHPVRWRYVPPGRIPPGNIFQRFFVTSFIVPKIEYEEASGLDLGVGLFDADFRGSDRQEFLGLAASRSTEGQETYGVIWKRQLAHYQLENGGVYYEERSALRLQALYDKTLTARFFGLGGDTESGDETNYTNEATIVGVSVQHGLPDPGSEVTGRVGVRFEHHNLAGGEDDELASTDDVFPELFNDGDSHDSWWLTLGLQYDSRDSDTQPYTGWDVELTVDMALEQSRESPALITTLASSWAMPIPSFFHNGGFDDEVNPPTDTIAVGGFIQSTEGDLPFYLRPSLGGQRTLRGYISNRFVADHVWHASAEWRTWPISRGVAFTDSIRIERIGLALFVDVGALANDLADLPDADIKTSLGLGVRWAFERTAVFRTDYAIGDEGGQFTASFGLTF